MTPIIKVPYGLYMDILKAVIVPLAEIPKPVLLDLFILTGCNLDPLPVSGNAVSWMQGRLCQLKTEQGDGWAAHLSTCEVENDDVDSDLEF
jgi:hypothetical protein